MFKVPLLPRKVSAAERDLQHAKVAVRVDAAKDLGLSGDSEQRSERVRLLIGALRDEHAAVRRQAVVSLADLEAREARSSLISLLADPELRVRQMTVLALGEVCQPGDREVAGRLASLLSAGDPAIRYQALIAHVRLLPEEQDAELVRALSDADGEVRELAVRLIDELVVGEGQKLAAKTVKALRAAAEDREGRVRLMAQLLLGDRGISAPTEMIGRVVRREIRCREPRDEQLAVELAGRLGLDDVRHSLVARAFGVLGYSFDPFRWSARAALGRMGDERALQRIEKGMSARSFVERNLAVQAAGVTGHAEFKGMLDARLGKPSLVDQEVLEAALESLVRGLDAEDSTDES